MAKTTKEIPPLTIKQRINFYRKCGRRGSDQCWEWTGCRNRYGYGQFQIGRGGYGAHRVAYALMVGEIPRGLHVLHRCDNRACVNPFHLWVGTNADNMRDRDAKGRGAFGKNTPTGERHGRAKLTAVEVLEIRKRCDAGGYTQTMLAAEYGVNDATISRIVNRKLWRQV